MKIKWTLNLDIYNTVTRQDLPTQELATGFITKNDEFKDLFANVDSFLPKDARYFQNAIPGIHSKSLTLQSPLSYNTDNEAQESLMNSPVLEIEPETDVPTILEVLTLIGPYLK